MYARIDKLNFYLLLVQNKTSCIKAVPNIATEYDEKSTKPTRFINFYWVLDTCQLVNLSAS